MDKMSQVGWVARRLGEGCPHCGWAALFLVRVLRPPSLKTKLPLTDTS